jgi:hypothetical protein
MNWLSVSAAVGGGGGGRSTYTQNEWPNFAMIDLLPGPYWPLLWARVTASAVMAVFIAHWCQDPNPDFRLLRHGGCIATGTERGVEAVVWFGFRVLGCRSTAKGAPWASFRIFHSCITCMFTRFRSHLSHPLSVPPSPNTTGLACSSVSGVARHTCSPSLVTPSPRPLLPPGSREPSA